MARLGLANAAVAFVLAACGHPSSKSADAAIVPDALPDGTLPIDAPIIDPGSPVCTPAPPPPSSLPAAAAAAGSRLVPRVLAEPVSGGLEVPFGVYDSLLGVYCEPVNYADLKVRCVPRPSELHLLSEKRWADAAKTIPVTLESVASPPAQGTLAGYYTRTQTCWSVSVELTRIGAARQGTYYFDNGGGLQAVPSGYGLFDLTPIPSDFVELTEQLAQLSGPISIRELHGTDGSSLFATQLHDTTHDVPVELTGNPTDGFRLLPPAINGLSVYRMYPSPPNGCFQSPDHIFSPVTTAFCDATALRYVREGTTTSTVYQVVAQYGTLWYCATNEVGTTIQQRNGPFLGSCGTVPLGDWTAASRITIGGGRLTATAYAVGNATYAPTWLYTTFDDATLGISCRPALATDDVLRCLPVYDLGEIVYTDSACTSRAILGFGTTPAYAEEGSIVTPVLNGLAGNITVFSVGAARPAGPIYARTVTGCSLLYNSIASYDVAGVVPPSTFAALTVRDVP